MKKSLINIITLAVSVANLVLMIILVFAIVPAMKNTNNLITTICTAISLELENSDGSVGLENVPIENIAVYNVSEQIMANLKPGTDLDKNGNPNPHYMILNVTISMNKADEDYATYGTAEAMLEREGLIRSRIQNIITQYTKEEAQANVPGLEEEVLASLRKLYNDSDFIIDVSFSDYIFQ